MFFVLMNWPVNQFELDPVNIAFSLTGRFTSQEIHGIYTSDPFLLAFSYTASRQVCRSDGKFTANTTNGWLQVIWLQYKLFEVIL